MASILIAVRTFVSISQVLAVVWLLKVAEKVTSECDTQDKWGGRVFVSKDSTVSLCARLALSVPAGMPLKHWNCPLLTEVVFFTGLPILGWHRGPPELWIRTDSLSSCGQSWYLLFLHFTLPKKKKKPDLILNLLYYLKYCDWLAQVESSLH